MIARRLTTIAECVRLWPFFRIGIEHEAKYLRYNHSLDVYRRILFSLVRNHENAWVAVVVDEEQEEPTPIAFVMAHDVTPLHAEEREFEVSMFYYVPGHRLAITFLQREFDKFCRTNQISRYYLTTSSFCSTASRVFRDAWTDLERSNTVFKRTLLLTKT